MAKKKRRKKKAKKRTYRKRKVSVGRPRKRTKKRATKRKRALGYRPSLMKRRGVRGLYPSYMGGAGTIAAKDATVMASLQRIVAPDTLKGVGAATLGLAAGRGIGALLIKYVPQATGQLPTVLGVLAGAAIGEVVGTKVFKSKAIGDMAAVGNLLIGIDLFLAPQINKAFGMSGLYEVNGLAQVRLPEGTDIMGLSQVRVPEGVDVAGIGYSDVPDVVTEEDLIEDKSLFG